jgi:hypothetical protein
LDVQMQRLLIYLICLHCLPHWSTNGGVSEVCFHFVEKP